MKHAQNKLQQSRNKREGFYAGYYPWHIHFGKGGHKRWDSWAMGEFYPRIQGVTWVNEMWSEAALSYFEENTLDSPHNCKHNAC